MLKLFWINCELKPKNGITNVNGNFNGFNKKKRLRMRNQEHSIFNPVFGFGNNQVLRK